jgi:uncharacterized membrane protein YphA (DoxX/SURF4 family)
MIDKMGSGFKEYAPFALRIGLAAIFIVRGALGISHLHQGHTAGLWAVIEVLVEILGGLFVLIGFQTRLAAFGLMCFVIYAIIEQHRWKTIFSEEHHIYFASLIMSFALFGLGGGKWSVDDQHKKKDSG